MVCEHMFKLKKNGEPNHRCYCRHPELIENYDKAVTDTTQTWEVHHRLECCFTQKFLKEMNLYYDVEPEALIFLTIDEHNKLHHIGMKHSEEAKRKISEAMINHKNYSKKNRSISNVCNGKLKTASGYHWKFV